jgi:hypothetical protein
LRKTKQSLRTLNLARVRSEPLTKQRDRLVVWPTNGLFGV